MQTSKVVALQSTTGNLHRSGPATLAQDILESHTYILPSVPEAIPRFTTLLLEFILRMQEVESNQLPLTLSSDVLKLRRVVLSRLP